MDRGLDGRVPVRGLRTVHQAHAPVDPQIELTGTLGGVLTDLVEVVEWLPMPLGRAEATARILDRLAEEIIEAASLLRQLPGDGNR